MRFKTTIILLLISNILIGCQLVQTDQEQVDLLEWSYSDVRLIDSVDAALQPDQDLIALYTRFNGGLFQIRLDFLDLSSNHGKDIYIEIATNPGGISLSGTLDSSYPVSELDWNYLLIVPSTGNIKFLDRNLTPIYKKDFFITRYYAPDSLVISFRKDILPITLEKTKIQVIVTSPGNRVIIDESAPVSIDGPPPPRVKVVLAFWNTFSASTPAQALRSWDGAHSGPYSSRHGLKYLIDAAGEAKVPIFLFDLLDPDNLSALDYLQALTHIRQFALQGLLVFPDPGESTQNGDLVDTQFETRLTRSDYELIVNSDSFIYESILNINFGVYDYAQFSNYYKDCEMLAIENTIVSTQDLYPSLKCRRLLVDAALSNPAYPLILGGNFANSVLGEPGIASEAFEYLRSHPWIQVVSAYDDSVLSLNLIKAVPELSKILSPIFKYEFASTLTIDKSSRDISSVVYQGLLSAPKNQLSTQAWQVYSMLTEPTTQALQALEHNYLGQIGNILYASKWAENPTSISTCAIDLDYDGVHECVLATATILVMIEPAGGYISFVFSVDARGVHQIIGPSWEFLVGLSDPSVWKLTDGVRADPGQLLGAFADNTSNWTDYETNVSKQIIYLYNDNMTMRKSIMVSDDSLQIDIQDQVSPSNQIFIPLVLDPWIRFTPSWGEAYLLSLQSSGTQWGLNSGESVLVSSNAPIEAYAFNSTRNAMFKPENPSFDYGSGHYLPFPMAVVEISGKNEIHVEIKINP